MEKAKLFEYVVILNPKPKKEGEQPDEKPRIVVPVSSVLVKSEKDAAVHASRAIPNDLVDRLDELDIVVRPF